MALTTSFLEGTVPGVLRMERVLILIKNHTWPCTAYNDAQKSATRLALGLRANAQLFYSEQLFIIVLIINVNIFCKILSDYKAKRNSFSFFWNLFISPNPYFIMCSTDGKRTGPVFHAERDTDEYRVLSLSINES